MNPYHPPSPPASPPKQPPPPRRALWRFVLCLSTAGVTLGPAALMEGFFKATAEAGKGPRGSGGFHVEEISFHPPLLPLLISLLCLVPMILALFRLAALRKR